MSDISISCRPHLNDYTGTLYTLEVAAGPLRWTRDLRDIDLENLADLASACLESGKGDSTPDWHYDKYPAQQHPELYERRAPAFGISRSEGDCDRWLVSIDDDSSMTLDLTGDELSEAVSVMRNAIDKSYWDKMLNDDLTKFEWDDSGTLIR